jgi:hypothetical protein
VAGDQLRARIDEAEAASAAAIDGLKEATADSSQQLGDRVDESAGWIVAAVEKLLGASDAERPMAEQAGTPWPELHAYRARVLLPGWKRVSWNAGRAPA